MIQHEAGRISEMPSQAFEAFAQSDTFLQFCDTARRQLNGHDTSVALPADPFSDFTGALFEQYAWYEGLASLDPQPLSPAETVDYLHEEYYQYERLIERPFGMRYIFDKYTPDAISIGQDGTMTVYEITLVHPGNDTSYFDSKMTRAQYFMRQHNVIGSLCFVLPRGVRIPHEVGGNYFFVDPAINVPCSSKQFRRFAKRTFRRLKSAT